MMFKRAIGCFVHLTDDILLFVILISNENELVKC